jgi:hypothetical protein
MVRRFISAIAATACLAGSVMAAERATFILTNGERKSGEVVFHGGNQANFIDGQLNLGDQGKETSYPIDQVAVIDFAGGTPAQTELAQVPVSGQTVVTRDGRAIPGKFVNIVRGNTLLWEGAGGEQQQLPVNSIARVYLNANSARTAFNYNGPAGGATGTGGTAPAGGRTINVDARQPWTDTGLTVNQGDRVSFQSSGQINYGKSAGMTASPDGAQGTNPRYPDPTVGVGALVGRIGTNGKPFGIGSQTSVVMPGSGRLYLGVNDNELGDNSGAFTVVVAKQ